MESEVAGTESGVDGGPVPLVVVEGFLSFHGPLAWGRFQDFLNSGDHIRPVIFARIGPVNSLHDRACELYFQLVGGTVDYGEEHAAEHRHGRYGRSFERGLYPRWSRHTPLHFFGHSMGGPTIVKLQHLLLMKFWGTDTHPDMILSVNAISAPFRGTQLVYALGERVDDAPRVRAFSVGSLLARVVHLLAYISPITSSVFDLHAESRNLAFHETSLRGLFGQLWKSDWAESRDAAPYDVTFRAADEREATGEGRAHKQTYYRSYAASMTERLSIGLPEMPHFPVLSGLLTFPFYLPAWSVAKFDYSILVPRPSFVPSGSSPTAGEVRVVTEQGDRPQMSPVEPLGEEYWANDGVIPLFSQWHPYPCTSINCTHSQRPTTRNIMKQEPGYLDADSGDPRPGVWYVHRIEGASHISLVPFWLATARQQKFWEELGIWLRTIDARSQEGTSWR